VYISTEMDFVTHATGFCFRRVMGERNVRGVHLNLQKK
jgi:hypothetical protein